MGSIDHHFQFSQPLEVENLGATHEHRLEQQLLSAEVVVDQRDVDPRCPSDISNGDRMETLLRKEQFSGIEYPLASRGRARRPYRLFLFGGRCRPAGTAIFRNHSPF